MGIRHGHPGVCAGAQLVVAAHTVAIDLCGHGSGSQAAVLHTISACSQ